MSRAEDRIPVPTNGHRPSLAEAAESPGSSRDDVAFNASPAQLAVGFGIITWAVAFLVGWWWRRRR